MRDELARVSELVTQLGQRQAVSLRGVEATLSAHAETTAALASTTQSLREALASPKTRGQWGERMAEDVLRLAGFVEHVNYEKQRAVEGGRLLPDYSFPLPKGHVLYMDVKFPLTAYLRYLDADTDAERSAHRDAFLRDVRLRVRELAGRDYAHQGTGHRSTTSCCSCPTRRSARFIHEHDPALVDDALRQKVVLCSPLTLFAMLGVIRQAFDNFMVEQTSEEILAVLGAFEQQWGKFAGALDTSANASTRRSTPSRTWPGTRGGRWRSRSTDCPRSAATAGIAVDEQFLPDADVVALDSNRGELARANGRQPSRQGRSSPGVGRPASGRPGIMLAMSQPSLDLDLDDAGDATYTVRELPDALNQVLRRGFRDGVWVRGEIEGLQRRAATSTSRSPSTTTMAEPASPVALFANTCVPVAAGAGPPSVAAGQRHRRPHPRRPQRLCADRAAVAGDGRHRCPLHAGQARCRSRRACWPASTRPG